MTNRIGRLVAAGALVVAMTAPAGAEEGRGFVFGGGVTSSGLRFANVEGRGLAIGPVEGYTVLPYGAGVIENRDLKLFDGGTPPPADTQRTIPFPKTSGGASMTMHFGYSFSPRVAVLADFDVFAPISEGLTQLVASAVVRYSPSSRLWVEAGPAMSELGYAYEGGAAGNGDIQGEGVTAAVGVNIVRKPKWTLGVQARHSRLWYDGFQTSSFSFGVSAGRVRSGKASGTQAAAVR